MLPSLYRLVRHSRYSAEQSALLGTRTPVCLQSGLPPDGSNAAHRLVFWKGVRLGASSPRRESPALRPPHRRGGPRCAACSPGVSPTAATTSPPSSTRRPTRRTSSSRTFSAPGRQRAPPPARLKWTTPDQVRQAIQDGSRRVVAAVLNAVDDSLSGGDPAPTRWTVGAGVDDVAARQRQTPGRSARASPSCRSGVAPDLRPRADLALRQRAGSPMWKSSVASPSSRRMPSVSCR